MPASDPTEFQIESARIEADADAEGLRAAQAAIEAAVVACEGLALSAHRHGTSVAADDAGGHLSLAADELRGALGLLGKVEDSDLAGELHDEADAASAAMREAV